MNRLLLRRCSMSSIEEEDESAVSDEPMPPKETSVVQPPCVVIDWDSELSESEQEFDDNDEHGHDNGEEQAANRVLKGFMQSRSSHYSIASTGNRDGCFSPFAIQLYDGDDESAELSLILTELQDFKSEFEECFNLPLARPRSLFADYHSTRSMMNSYPSKSVSTNGCVYELRTLEDQLEAALASLTLTINDCTMNKSDVEQEQQRSSDSSACSSGLGDEIGNESFNLYQHSSNGHHHHHHHPGAFASKIPTILDDGDSAFSDSGSTDKVTLPNHDESLFDRSMLPVHGSRNDTALTVTEQDDTILFHSQPSKILVRTYNDDGSTKSIFIDDSMSIRDILFILIHKNHREPDMDYVIVEILPDLHMERIFEDHQKLSEAILMWPTVSSNRLNFTKRSEKYSLFRTFTSDDEFQQTPDIEGVIHFKEKSRKSWKKFVCVLRSSGLYFIPKGKSKKDLVCLAKFENVELFFGLDWKKKFKSPSEFCFALKHPLIQKKSSKYIKYMCVETKNEFDRWTMNIRIAKFAQQLKMNYLLMDKAMRLYRSSGRLTAVYESRAETALEQRLIRDDVSAHGRHTPLSHSSYGSVQPSTHSHAEVETKKEIYSPIKSASYMDELRQRLERVLSDQSTPKATSYLPVPASISNKGTLRRPTLIPPPKLKSTKSQVMNSTENIRRMTPQIKSPLSIGSTPLPRKHLQPMGALSYRTMHPLNHHSQQQMMSKSFILPSKREEHRSATSSSLSITSKSDSLNLDDADLSFPSPILLSTLDDTKSTHSLASKSTIGTPLNRSKVSPSSLPIRSRITPPSLKLSTCISQTRQNTKTVPLVPPRKSSILPTIVLPQRDSSAHLHSRKPYVSHL